jgi:hypothetical protein
LLLDTAGGKNKHRRIAESAEEKASFFGQTQLNPFPYLITMKALTPSEKERILSRLFWDVESKQTGIDKLIEEKLQTFDNPQSQQFFCRLLSSCDWYTLLKLIPPQQLKVVLSDQVLDKLFPRDLKTKYKYARDLLSR